MADGKVDLSGLSVLAKIGLGVTIFGLLLALSGLLNQMGLEFKGFSVLDAVFGPEPLTKVYVGFPVLLAGGIAFRIGGGKQYMDAQKAK